MLANHTEVLATDPLEQGSLAALARHHVEIGDHDRAHALYKVLALRAPEHPDAIEYLARASVVSTPGAELDVGSVVPALPADGGVGEALLALQDGGAALLGEFLPRLDVPPEARISPLGEGLLAQCWGEVLKRIPAGKVALVAAHALPNLTEVGHTADGVLEVRCQQPPIILAHADAFTTTDASALRFALARALYFTRPDTLFALGLPRSTLAQLLSAVLQAFHPRHTRRKHHQRPDDEVARFGQELLRKLPMRVSRQLGSLFKDHEIESFDSQQWRMWIRRAGNRVGLVIAGDLAAAIRAVAKVADTPTGDDLARAVERDDDLRDLLSFAVSASYAAVRRALGHEVQT